MMYGDPKDLVMMSMYDFTSGSKFKKQHMHQGSSVMAEQNGHWYLENRYANPVPRASRILNDPDLLGTRRWPDYFTLREVPPPWGAENVMFVRPGRLSFSLASYRAGSKFCTVNAMPRDAFAVWEDMGCNLLTDPLVPLTIRSVNDGVEETLETAMYSVRQACGVVFARTLELEVGAHCATYEIGWREVVRFTTIRLEMLVGGAKRPDKVRMWFQQHHVNIRPGESITSAFPNDGWGSLVAIAAQGFEEHCTTHTPEIKAMYEELLATEKRDRHAADKRYRDRRFGRF